MAKISFKLDRRRVLSDGAFPLRIAVSNRGETAYVNTHRNYTEEEWEKERVLLSGRGGRLVGARSVLVSQKLLLEAALLRLDAEEGVGRLGAAALRDRLLAMISEDGVLTGPARREESSPLFLPYYRQEMDSKDTDGTRKQYRRTLRLVVRYEDECGRDPESLSFSDITPGWLRGFDAWMAPTNGVSSRSINMRNIRAVINGAIEDGLTVDYPFSRSGRRGRSGGGQRHKFRIQEDGRPTHRALTAEQFRALRDVKVAPHQEKYRDLFLLMVYLIGVNPVDLLKARPDQLIDGRLDYERQKTHVWYSIKVEPEALAIIERYRGKEYLLEPCDNVKDYRYFLRRMNEQLKLIGLVYDNRQRHHGEPLFPRLTAYWARHTWTSVAVNNGIPKYTAGVCLGHSWARDKVTDRYISLDDRLIDEANRRLIDILNGGAE